MGTTPSWLNRNMGFYLRWVSVPKFIWGISMSTVFHETVFVRSVSDSILPEGGVEPGVVQCCTGGVHRRLFYSFRHRLFLRLMG